MPEIPEVADLSLFYRPKSMAIVGAHDARDGLAGFTDQALRLARRVGARFYPINPKLPQVYGVDTLPNVAALPEPVDVMCIFTGKPIEVLRDAAEAGVRAKFVMVFASGFSELQTPDGYEREALLVKAVHGIGARLIGPNTNMNAWAPLAEQPGQKVAVITHSGNQGRSVVELVKVGVGISYWAPTGNEADLEFTDFAELFARDEETAAVLAYLEGARSGDSLRNMAATAIEAGTPIAVVKVGRSAAGSSMAQSHTGHLTGSDEVWDAFFTQFGISRVTEMDELAEVGAALARSVVPTADGVVVCSASGGAAAHVADLATMAGLHLPRLSEETQAALRDIVPSDYRVDNPVDNGGPAMFTGAGPKIWQLCLEDPAVGLMLCPVPASSAKLTDAVIDTLVAVAPTATKPILPIWLGPYEYGAGYDRLWQAGLPVFRNIRNALNAARALINHPARNPELREVAKLVRAGALRPALPRPLKETGRLLREQEATDWLEQRGFRFARHQPADSADAAVTAARDIGYPVVVKGADVAHKSEGGLVKTGLRTDEEVRAAASEILGKGAAGLLVARHESGGIEMLLGLSTDDVFGPVIVVGAGGVTAEAVRDVSRAVLPLTEATVNRMLSSLRIAPLLGGWRGQPPVDQVTLVETILKLGALAADGEVAELDINPLLVRPDGVVGLDALIRLA
ncbi:MAG TPA: acetate--CoA ligase family protein [Trebonia sp.]|jgi:acyl-CoA synthetase (NDP forming)